MIMPTLPIYNQRRLSALRSPALPLNQTPTTELDVLNMPYDFREQPLRWRSFRNRSDIAGADFSRADLTGADFRGCDLRGARFDDAILLSAQFDRANISGTSFAAAHLGRTKLRSRLINVPAFFFGLLCSFFVLVFSSALLHPSDYSSPLAYGLALSSLTGASAAVWKFGAKAGCLLVLSLCISLGARSAGYSMEVTAILNRAFIGTILSASFVAIGPAAVFGGQIGTLLWSAAAVGRSAMDGKLDVSFTAVVVGGTLWTLLLLFLLDRRVRTRHDHFKGLARLRDGIARLGATSFRDTISDEETFFSSARVVHETRSATQAGDAPASSIAREQIAVRASLETRRRLRHVAVVVCAAIVLLLAIIVTASVPGLSWWVPLIVLLAGLVSISLYGRFVSLFNTDRSVVLWIRKFRADEEEPPFHWLRPKTWKAWITFWHVQLVRTKKIRRLQVLIEFGCIGWGNVITLSDTNVRSDSNERLESSIWYVVAATSTTSALAMSTGEFDWYAVGGITAFTCIQVAFRRWFRRRPVLSPATHRYEVASVLRHIRTGKGKLTAVFRCPRTPSDTLWQDVVRYIADKVDVVIISGDEGSEHLIWERNILIDDGHVPPESFVVLRTDANATRPLDPDDRLAAAPIIWLHSVALWRTLGNWKRVGTAVGTAILSRR